MPNFFMEWDQKNEMEDDKWKKASQVRNIMQSSRTFIKISEPIPEVRKTALINDWLNTMAYWEESEQGKVLVNKFGLFSAQLMGLGWDRLSAQPSA